MFCDGCFAISGRPLFARIRFGEQKFLIGGKMLLKSKDCQKFISCFQILSAIDPFLNYWTKAVGIGQSVLLRVVLNYTLVT